MGEETASSAKDGWVRIHNYSNWCEYDCYGPPVMKNGFSHSCDKIENGDRVLVRWPNGTESEHVVELEKSSYREMDMGHYTDIPVHRAFVKVSVNGSETRVALRNKDLLVKKL